VSKHGKKYLNFPKNILFSIFKRRQVSKIKESVIWFEYLLQEDNNKLEREVKPEEIAAIFYTTGTTGSPKSVFIGVPANCKMPKIGLKPLIIDIWGLYAKFPLRNTNYWW